MVAWVTEAAVENGKQLKRAQHGTETISEAAQVLLLLYSERSHDTFSFFLVMAFYMVYKVYVKTSAVSVS